MTKDTKPDMEPKKSTKSFRQSLAQRRQTITVQMEKMVREVKEKYRKRFYLVIGLIILIIVAFIVYAIVAKVRAKDICRDDVCYEIAESMYQNMDTSVDPCDDFYSFVCGGWIKNNPRPEKKEYWSILAKLKDTVMERLKGLLEDENDFNVSLPLIKAKNFFKSCVDTETRDRTLIDGLKHLVRQIGGFPLIDNQWSERDFKWQDAISHLQSRQVEVTPFFSLSSRGNYRTNYTTKILEVSTVNFGIGSTLNSDYYSHREKMEAEMSYRKKVKKLLSIFGVDINSNNERSIDREIDSVIEFESEIAKAEKSAGRSSNIYWSARNASKYINFDLHEIIQNILVQLNFARHFETNDTIMVESIEYLKKLGDILNKTNKRTIANYIGTLVLSKIGGKTIMQLINYDRPGREFTYQDMISNCYWSTEQYFRLPIHKLYIDKYFKKGALEELREFVKHLKASLTITLQMNDWMDDDTKIQAQHKLNKMLDLMATPPNIAEIYNQLGYMEAKNYFENYMKILRFQAKNVVSLSKRKEYGVAVVNAFYSPYENQIEVTPGILQPPIYYSSSPIVMNFAAIGTIIGHEITHGFDDSGSRYDAEGRFRNWWTNDTLEKYQERVKCFKDQYSQYTEPKTGLKVNGTTTIGDNIADNGGLHQSFRAYKLYASAEDNKMDLRLPGDMSDYSKEQLFYISYGNVWCENHAEEYTKMLLKHDPHAPSLFRCNVPMSNSEEFANAFKCKAGSPMNPIKKCSLW